VQIFDTVLKILILPQNFNFALKFFKNGGFIVEFCTLGHQFSDKKKIFQQIYDYLNFVSTPIATATSSLLGCEQPHFSSPRVTQAAG